MAKHSPGFLALVEDARSRVREISVDEYAALREGGQSHLLVDVREDGEWSAGHAAGATHIGKGVIERDIEGLVPDKQTKLILYCGGGYRSLLSGDALQKMGYEEVLSLSGGWKAWKERGLPVES
jgi:rhodanese-related sulfurtransferase